MQAVWLACESCMYACLAIRRLACDTKRVQRAHSRARCCARPPSSPRRCHERSLLCKTNARSILDFFSARCQRCKNFAPRTGSSMGTGGDPSAVPVAHAEYVPGHAKPRNGARLRAALAIFYGKANAVQGNRLSGGAIECQVYSIVKYR